MLNYTWTRRMNSALAPKNGMCIEESNFILKYIFVFHLTNEGGHLTGSASIDL